MTNAEHRRCKRCGRFVVEDKLEPGRLLHFGTAREVCEPRNRRART